MMKLGLLILTVCFAVIQCSPGVYNTEGSLDDRIALGKIEQLIQDLREVDKPKKYYQYTENSNDITRNGIEIADETKSPRLRLQSVIANSLDKKCMLRKYKQHNLVDLIPTDNLTPEEHIEKSLISGIAFVDIALSCSNKTDPILKFIFENLMTYQTLLSAFINEPELEEFSDMLKCATKFVVDKRILNLNAYPFKYQMSAEKEEKCTEYEEKFTIMELGLKMSIREKVSSACAIGILEDVENFSHKYLLLIQIELNDQENLNERNNFIKDFHKLLDSILDCAETEVALIKN